MEPFNYWSLLSFGHSVVTPTAKNLLNIHGTMLLLTTKVKLWHYVSHICLRLFSIISISGI